jgi:uncharacterized damage-inducible protein DinB
MYNSIREFTADWDKERDYTLRIFKNLTDDSLDIKCSPEGRTAGRIAWHITSSVSEMGRKAELAVSEIDDNAAYPSAVEIYNLYDKVSSELKTETAKWNDEMLKDEINMYGETWTRSFTLEVLIRHQIHHRGQLTILMRQAGLKVPGIYGPSREEWSLYNLEPML